MVLANVGVPMLMLVLPVMVLALAPIVLIEAGVLFAREGLSYKRGVLHAAVANAVSTLVGVPLAWVVVFVMQMAAGSPVSDPADLWSVLGSMAWMGPGDDDPHWLIPAAAVMLQGPFFVISWFSELLVLAAFRRDVPPGRLVCTVGLANAATYLMLALFWALWIVVPTF